MANEFKLPDLGEGVDSATVGSILVEAGQAVAQGAMLMELESEKATLPVTATFSGSISGIAVKLGDTVKSGSVVLTYEIGANAESAPAKSKPTEQPAASKASAAPAAASQANKSSGEGEAANANAASGGVNEAARDKEGSNSAKPPTGPIAASPTTRRLARELGVDLVQTPATGPGGRTTKDDVKRQFARQSGGGGKVSAPPLPDFSQFGPTERKALNAVGKASARNLSLSWQVVPHVTQHELADVTDLENARRDFVKSHSKAPKVTMTVLAMKAAVAAMREFPQFNASFDADTNEIILKKYFHFGVAVDTEHGLMVPVVRDADKKSLVDLASEITEIAEKARSKKLDPAHMKGGSFTITNLGGIGGTYFTPIVNYPEVAILGLARSREEYVKHNGAPAFRLMLPISLSYDHRAINGADAARFVSRLGNLLADPFTMLAQL